MLDPARWGAAALPRLSIDQLRLLTETLSDTYCAGYLAGQLRERLLANARAAEDFFAMLSPDIDPKDIHLLDVGPPEAKRDGENGATAAQQ